MATTESERALLSGAAVNEWTSVVRSMPCREGRNTIALVEHILNSLPFPILLHGGGSIVSINDAFSQLFGIDRERTIGRHCQEILEDIHLEGQVADRIFRGECFAHVESHGRRQNGEEIHLALWQTRLEPFAGTNEGEVFFLVTMTDVSWQRRIERELRQAQKLEAVGQLAAGIAHEINTPTQYVGDNVEFLASAVQDLQVLIQGSLAVIDAVRTREELSREIAEIDALAEETDLNYLFAELPTAIEHSRDGIQQISRIVLAVKEFSHPIAEEKSLVDLNHALENTVTISRNEWKHVAQVDMQLDPTLGAVPCLPAEMNQVFLNLVVNSAHALAEAGRTAETGRITVSTDVENEYVAVRITDNGKGIPTEIQDRVFNPFFTTKGVGKGTGQGLAIARDIVVAKHGGKIDFETQKDVGTTFAVRLPLTVVSSPAADGSQPDGTGVEGGP
ncbi:MAG: PAS domain S-box protein [Burkholderiaceae bacterium]|nr:PAS domain S-box protein [Burkholderiaceae bacterium]